MTARVLVVDDIVANVRLLEAKLSAEYFEVVTAMNGLDALESVQRSKPDIILLDVMMPGLDGIEVCKRIKADASTQHIPVIMVTALDQPEDKIRGLEAGADDFLTKPVNDISLFCRIKSLVRLKMLTDELRIRMGGTNSGTNPLTSGKLPGDQNGRILLVDAKASSVERITSSLGTNHQLTSCNDPMLALNAVREAPEPFELAIISLDEDRFDGLRLCSQLRSTENTRQMPILVITNPDDQLRLMKALDMGVNDYLVRPVDRQELMARVNTQVRRWRYTEELRYSVKASIELAITDALTGLYNRRYLETHLSHLVEHSMNRGKALSVAALDVDFFKAINDTYGHDAGDKVLQELSQRIKFNTRSIDLCCRVGGEEFILILPGTDLELAEKIAERLRRSVASKPFTINQQQQITVTLSAGVSDLQGMDDSVEKLLKRADQALYSAKREGRNRVIRAAA
jgi:two-component system, cell cycle response regulator